MSYTFVFMVMQVGSLVYKLGDFFPHNFSFFLVPLLLCQLCLSALSRRFLESCFHALVFIRYNDHLQPARRIDAVERWFYFLSTPSCYSSSLLLPTFYWLVLRNYHLFSVHVSSTCDFKFINKGRQGICEWRKPWKLTITNMFNFILRRKPEGEPEEEKQIEDYEAEIGTLAQQDFLWSVVSQIPRPPSRKLHDSRWRVEK